MQHRCQFGQRGKVKHWLGLRSMKEITDVHRRGQPVPIRENNVGKLPWRVAGLKNEPFDLPLARVYSVVIPVKLEK